jgi:hypothetical protein
MDRIQQAFAEGWLQVRRLADPMPLTVAGTDALGRGEAEAMLLAEEFKADLLITDDALARADAMRRGLAVVGTVGVLTQARDEGFIHAALPLLLESRRLGEWISEALLRVVRENEMEQST